MRRATPAAALHSLALLWLLHWASSQDFSTPLELIDALASLPPAQQETLLMLAGMTLQLQTGMDCNMFGGALSCKLLPANSSYLQQCPGADPKVDCAFYGQVLGNLYDSPADDLQAFVSAREGGAAVAQACPQCFAKLQSLWCALASPRCGTFRTYTRVGLLPGLTAVVQAYNKGDGELEALSEAVAGSIDALGAALPCREMCEDLMATCGCSDAQSDTFGQLVDWMAARAPEGRSPPPAAFQRVLFKRVWDRPFCALFAPRDSANISGACSPDPAATCAARGAWCAGSSSSGSSSSDAGGESAADLTLRHVQGVVLVQLVRAAVGWIVDDATGLWRTKGALASGDSRTQLDALRAQYVDGRVREGPRDGAAAAASYGTPGGGGGGGGSMQTGQVVMVVLLTLLGVAVAAGVGFAGYRLYTSRSADRSYLELGSGTAFRPLDDGL